MKRQLKNALFLLLTTVLFAGCETKVDDNSTLEKLAETVFTMVKFDDRSLLDKYFIAQDHIEWFKENSKQFDEQNERSLRYDLQFYRDDLSKMLRIVKDKFSEKGLVDWSATEFQKATYKIDNSDNLRYARLLRVFFSNGDHLGVIKITEVFEKDQRWYLKTVPVFESYSMK